MKIKNYLIAAALAAMFASLNFCLGSLIVENDYEGISANCGGIGGSSLSLKAKKFSGDALTFLNYKDKNDRKPESPIVKLNDYFKKKSGTYSVSKNINGKILKVDFEINQIACTPGEPCMLEKDNIQDFHCKILKATLNGIELAKRPTKNDL